MIELNRHIEILLLSSDCVIVPDLGGFTAQHVDAVYDNEDHMFVPPLRTLGFNPQLNMNDSFLAQSYIEAYDINYPEAVQRIEAEVTELKQQLYNEGIYEMPGIGVLSLNEDRRIVFEPCEAGLLTPALYGLTAFEMLPLASETESKVLSIAPQSVDNEANTTKEEPVHEDGEQAIVIKMSWIRNVAAVAAAVIAILFLIPSIDNSDDAEQQPSMSQVELLPMPKTVEQKKLDTSVVNIKPDSATAPVAESAAPADSTIEEKVAMKPAPEPKAQEEKEEEGYCLVLASQVAKQGAEYLVEQMKQRGYEDTRINVHKQVRRVVYGHYASQNAAYQALNKLRSSSSDFDEAWVYKMN